MAAVAGSLAAAAAMCVLVGLVSRVDRAVARRVGPPTPQGRAVPRVPGAAAALRRLGAGGLGRRVGSPQLRELLERAGDPRPAEEVVGLKLSTAGLGALLGIAPGPPLALVAPVALGVLGFRLPDLGLARKARGRFRAADAELPQLLDVLAASSSAGLGAPLALRRAADATLGPLGVELREMVRAIDLGARWRDELQRLADRLPLPDLRRTVGVLGRTERLGTPLSEALEGLAARVRESRSAAAAERARTAPVKMLFPLVFLVLPAFLLLTVVPVLLTTVRSI